MEIGSPETGSITLSDRDNSPINLYPVGVKTGESKGTAFPLDSWPMTSSILPKGIPPPY